MLGKSMADFSVEAFDYWAWTCILYQMVVGTPPFRGSNEYQTFKKIMALDYSLPKTLSDSCRSSIKEAFALINSNNNGEFSKSFRSLRFLTQLDDISSQSSLEDFPCIIEGYTRKFLLKKKIFIKIQKDGRMIVKSQSFFKTCTELLEKNCRIQFEDDKCTIVKAII